jgi:pyruvate/2-oxoglutarate dehydrogenase complex dihydrolipoamide dehydrogenase (E3) component
LYQGSRSTRDRLMPSCLFTDPQVAQVGLTEAHAKRMGIAFEAARLPMAAILRTRTISEMQGFMKALIAPRMGAFWGSRWWEPRLAR